MNIKKTKEIIRIACIIAVCVITLYSGISLGATGIYGGKHDLSETGASGFTFVTGTNDGFGTGSQPCVFCHAPHRGKPALTLPNVITYTTVYNTTTQYTLGSSSAPMLLWNRVLSNQTSFSYYTSSSMSSPTYEVRAYSLLCLSCHDGISALNVMYSYPGQKNSALEAIGGFTMLANVCNSGPTPGWYCNIGDRVTGTDPLNLSNDHPVSFDYTGGTGLVAPSVGYVNTPAVRLFPNPQTGLKTSMECSTCHDPHGESDDTNPMGPFLVLSKANSTLCLNCHIK